MSNKPSIEQLISIALKIADFIKEKVQTGQWTGKFRKTTKDTLRDHSDSLSKLSEANEVNAAVNEGLYKRILDLERRMLELESK